MSIIGILYAVFIGIFFFVAHLLFIANLRGNAVRLGPDQMPDLYERVVELSKRVGLTKVPDAYLVQMGGSLNALATRFLRSNFIVLYSDLLDACGDNTDARDFIVAHELGHLHAGHLRWRWFLIPGLAIPFLGTTYSRACEYTSDRYGLATSSDEERALDGLCILAAGGKLGPSVNRRSLVAQRADLNTVFMKIGQWLGTHPPISHRLAVLQPSLATEKLGGVRATAGAFVVLAAVILIPIVGTVAFAQGLWPQIQAAMQQQQAAADATDATIDPEARAEAERGILSLVEAAEHYQASAGLAPPDRDQLYGAWSELHPGEAEPLDPFDSARYGYQVGSDGEYIIWTAGPTADDDDNLYFSSAEAVE